MKSKIKYLEGKRGVGRCRGRSGGGGMRKVKRRGWWVRKGE